MTGEDTTQAAFWFGMGIMGVIAGFGLGSKEPNKLALMIGAGSLFYANHLNPVVDVTPRPEIREAWQDLPGKLPSMPSFPGIPGVNGLGARRCCGR